MVSDESNVDNEDEENFEKYSNVRASKAERGSVSRESISGYTTDGQPKRVSLADPNLMKAYDMVRTSSKLDVDRLSTAEAGRSIKDKVALNSSQPAIRLHPALFYVIGFDCLTFRDRFVPRSTARASRESPCGVCSSKSGRSAIRVMLVALL